MVVVQSFSLVRLFVTPWTAARQASLSFTIFQSLLKLVSIESLMPSNHRNLCCLCCLLLLPSIYLRISIFSKEPALHIKWPKDWSFSISPSSEYSGLISFRMDWFDTSRDSQESSPVPQFESINSLALGLLYGPIHT